MNVKTGITIVLALAVGILSFILLRSCNENTDLKKIVANNDEIIATLRGELDSTNFVLSQTLEKNNKLQQALDTEAAIRRKEGERAANERKKLLGKITTLETELEPLIAANPKLAELLAAYKAADVASQAQIASLTEERDIWIQKYTLKDQDFQAAMLAKAQMQASLEKSLEAFTKCNNELVKADRTIQKLKSTNKLVKVVALVETGIIGAMALSHK